MSAEISSTSFRYRDMRARGNASLASISQQNGVNFDTTKEAPAASQDEYRERDIINPIGIYGWRKRCLYCLIVLIIVLVFVNLAITIWILVVLNFNIHGMGLMRITDEGVRLEGLAEFTDPLITTNITSSVNSSLSFSSHQNVSIDSVNASIELGQNDIQIMTDSFQVMANSASDTPLLSMTANNLTLQSNLLNAGGEQGVSFGGAVETQLVRAPEMQSLSLEASEGSVDITGHTGVLVRANDGPVDVVGSENLLLASNGSISLAANVIKLEGLTTSVPVGAGKLWEGVHQVCICPNGKLFLVAVTDTIQGCAIPLASNICQ